MGKEGKSVNLNLCGASGKGFFRFRFGVFLRFCVVLITALLTCKYENKNNPFL